MNMHTPIGADRIAIVGMAGRFPGAPSVRDLWKMLRDKREAATWLTDDELREAGIPEADIQDPSYVRACLPLPNVDCFDNEFFGFTPKEASILDPQHRQFFETVWEAFEDAGVDPQKFPGAIGVFAGSGQPAYYATHILPNPDLVRDVGHFLLRHTGNDKDFLPTRVSYLLNLQGPSMAVQTACSTSLVAVHLACQSLLSGECDMALAGGVTVELPQIQGYRYKTGEILSVDGHCRSFDKDATGTIFGSGVGVVVLRRLSDALRDGDPIRAIICGSAVNNDGSRKAGYLAPSVDGQAQAAAEALSMADVDPSSVDYVEAHGTGTIVGDPIELTALSQAYQTDGKSQFCGIGSIKTNIGHLDTAAGVASLIKVVLALENKEIPASLNYSGPNPHFDIAKSPFYVAGQSKPWPRTNKPRRAGVNSIGVGGTNAHVILEEAPASAPTPSSDSTRLLTLSAKSEASLKALLTRWDEFLADAPTDFNLADAAYTLRHGRRTFNHRCAIVASNAADLARAIKERDARQVTVAQAADKPDVVFMFPGGGAQFIGAGRELLRAFPAFRAAVEQCFAAMPASAPKDLREIMFSPAPAKKGPSLLQDARYGLPALFVLEYALARLWMSWGVKPAGLIGHSSGEYAAAAIAEVMSVRDALEIVCFRAKLFASLPAGAMTAVAISAKDLRNYVEEELDVAAINAPELCVASGPEPLIQAFEGKLSKIGIDAKRLRIDVAAHSRMLDGVLDEFRTRLKALRFAAPRIPLISNLTGDWLSHSDLTDADYWVQHLRQTVRFSDGVQAALNAPNRILLEVGPGQQLIALARLNATGENRPVAFVASTPSADDSQSEHGFLLQSAGRLWAHGVDIDLEAVSAPAKGRRISLPTYAFEKKRHWIERGQIERTGKSGASIQSTRLEKRSDWFSETQWKKKALASVSAPVAGTWLVFSDAGPTALALCDALRARGVKIVTVTIGSEFVRTDDGFSVNPLDASSYTRLFEELGAEGLSPDVIVHFWSLLETGAGAAYPVFNSALAICRRLQLAEGSHDRRLLFVTSGSQRVLGEDIPHPQRAMLVGACRVAPREISRLSAQVVDLDLPSAAHASQLLMEIDAGLPDELVAYRGSERWKQETIPAPQALAPPPGRLRHKGTYLITGGLGDVGLLLADYLAHAVSANLVLVGRTDVPPRKRWPDIIKNEPSTNRAIRIRALLALEAAGAQTLALQANVASKSDMDMAIKKARAAFGRIDGVIHAAGALRDAPIALKTSDSIREVVGAKVIGAENLHALLPEGSVDFFAVFSSTSALSGIAGQIDYAGANAAAAAIAESRRDGLAIYWGAWADVGMAARGYGLSEPRGENAGHPLLGLIDKSDADRAFFYATYDPSVLWPVREHVVEGAPTLPASAYLEILNAAARRLGYGNGVRIRNLSILSPMTFPDSEPRRIRISVKVEKSGLDFVIESSSTQNQLVVEHARALVEPAPLTPVPNLDAQTIRDLAHVSVGQVLKAPQGDRLGFGPRWLNIRGLAKGAGRAMGVFILPEAFEKDCTVYTTHPALCDMAMSVGLSLLDGIHDGSAFYAPMSIDSVEFTKSLPQRVYSVATIVDQSDDLATFDVKFIDTDGKPVAEIYGITYRRIMRGSMSPPSTQNDQRDVLLRSGIRAVEAPALFDRVLRSNHRSIIVSPTRLPAPGAKTAAQKAGGASVDSIEHSSFSDPVERALERIWCDLLGLDRISAQDDFFALGGHSLIAVRLFARIRSEFNVDLPLASLFKAPRVPLLAEIVRDHGTQESMLPDASPRTDPKDTAPQHSAAEKNWTPLFNIKKGSAEKTPLFLLPGGDGGYFKLRELAPMLRGDWPVYVLRMRGLEDSLAPHETIEAMASANIEAIRSVQPSGPYRLAGFSGGGVVAYEMTSQLKKMNESVESLIMFDTLCPGAATKSRNPLLRIWAARLWSAPFAVESAKRMGRRALNALTGKRDPSSASPSAVIGDEPDRMLERYIAIFDQYMGVQAKYKLKRLKTNIVLLRASAVQATWMVAGRCLGWDKWVDGKITTHRIHAHHHSLFVQPAISNVAQIVETNLRECDSRR